MRAALLVLVALLAAPAPGIAATVRVEQEDDPGYRGGGYRSDEVVITAGPGEANDLTVTTDVGAVRVLDAGAAITAGAGCVDDGLGAVRCARRTGASVDLRAATGDGDDQVAVGPGPSYVTVDAGDGDDAVAVERAVSASLTGGPGADRLSGASDALNSLTGGPGADVLVGAADGFTTYAEGSDDRSPDRLVDTAGRGRVIYAGRAEPVEVDLAAGTGGAPGEGDVLDQVEGVVLGPAGGRVLGTEEPDELDAGVGTVDGRGGDDELHAEGGTVVCGAGTDTVHGRPAAVARDCEVLDLFDVVLELSAVGRRTELALSTPETDFPLCAARVNGRTMRLRRGAGRVVLPRASTAVRLRFAVRCPKGRAPRWRPGTTAFALVPS